MSAIGLTSKRPLSRSNVALGAPGINEFDCSSVRLEALASSSRHTDTRETENSASLVIGVLRPRKAAEGETGCQVEMLVRNDQRDLLQAISALRELR